MAGDEKREPATELGMQVLTVLLHDEEVRGSFAYGVVREKLVECGFLAADADEAELEGFLVRELREELLTTLVPDEAKDVLEKSVREGGREGLALLEEELGRFGEETQEALAAEACGSTLRHAEAAFRTALHCAASGRILEAMGYQDEAMFSYRNAAEQFASALGVDIAGPEGAKGGPGAGRGGAGNGTKVLPFRSGGSGGRSR